jgi:DNA-binding MarR family transcriptional regulator
MSGIAAGAAVEPGGASPAGASAAGPSAAGASPAGPSAAGPSPAGPSAAGASAAGAIEAGSASAAAGPAIDAARLRVAVLRLSRRLRKHDLAGLTPSQLSTLATVGKHGPVRLGDLAATERIAPSTLTRLISVLEDKGLVHRDAAPGDARAFLVSVTEPGVAVLEQIKQEATSLLADMLMTLPPDQLAALADALPALEQLSASG